MQFSCTKQQSFACPRGCWPFWSSSGPFGHCYGSSPLVAKMTDRTPAFDAALLESVQMAAALLGQQPVLKRPAAQQKNAILKRPAAPSPKVELEEGALEEDSHSQVDEADPVQNYLVTRASGKSYILLKDGKKKVLLINCTEAMAKRHGKDHKEVIEHLHKQLQLRHMSKEALTECRDRYLAQA